MTWSTFGTNGVAGHLVWRALVPAMKRQVKGREQERLNAWNVLVTDLTRATSIGRAVICSRMV